MTLIRFKVNHEDLSTYRGRQFKFFCDQCGSGYVTRHDQALTGPTGVVLGFLEFFGWQRWFSACFLAGELEKSGRGSPPQEDTFAKAVAECQGHFHRCPRCDSWVCPENCWNEEAHECRTCAPHFQQELKANVLPLTTARTDKPLRAEARKIDCTNAFCAITPADGLASSVYLCSECGSKASDGRCCAVCEEALLV